MATDPIVQQQPPKRLEPCRLCLNDPETPCSRCRAAMEAEERQATLDDALAIRECQCAECADARRPVSERTGAKPRIFAGYHPQPMNERNRDASGRFAR